MDFNFNRRVAPQLLCVLLSISACTSAHSADATANLPIAAEQHYLNDPSLLNQQLFSLSDSDLFSLKPNRYTGDKPAIAGNLDQWTGLIDRTYLVDQPVTFTRIFNGVFSDQNNQQVEPPSAVWFFAIALMALGFVGVRNRSSM